MTPTRIPVVLHAADPLSEAGLNALLHMRADVRLAGPDEAATAAVVVSDTIDDALLQSLRRIHRTSAARIVLIVPALDGSELLEVAACGTSAVLRRAEAHAEALVSAITAVTRGEAHVPPDLLESLLSRIQHVRPGSTPGGSAAALAGLKEREVEVLKLVAEGLSTAEIANELAYSDRTIKNVLHGLMTRLDFATRSQAVAWATKRGLL